MSDTAGAHLCRCHIGVQNVVSVQSDSLQTYCALCNSATLLREFMIRLVKASLSNKVSHNPIVGSAHQNDISRKDLPCVGMATVGSFCTKQKDSLLFKVLKSFGNTDITFQHCSYLTMSKIF